MSSASRCLNRMRSLLHPLEEARLQDHVEHRVARRHGQRIAAEGRAVGARRSCPWPPPPCQARRRSESRRRAPWPAPSRRASRRAAGSRTDSPSRPRPVCTSSNASSRPCSSHSARSARKNCGGAARMPPSPCTGSIRMPAVSGPMARLTASMSPSGTWSKPSIIGPKPSMCFAFLAAAERRQRAAVERALEGDDAVALRPAVRRLVFAHHLDDAFHRLGAGVGEEHRVGEACGAQPVGQPLALRDAVEIGDVQHLGRLRRDRRDQVRMRMAERVDRDARGEIEIALAVGRDQPSALAPLESEIDTRIGWQHMRSHGPLTPARTLCRNEMCRLFQAARWTF